MKILVSALAKPVPSVISRHGYKFRLLNRGSRSMIYSQSDADGKIICFCTFLIKVAPERIINGKILPEAEKFPSPSSKYFYSFKSLESAIVMFNQLEKEFKNHQYYLEI